MKTAWKMIWSSSFLIYAMSCHAQVSNTGVSRFVEDPVRGWVTSPSGGLEQDAAAAAQITCRQDRSANIQILWRAESGDWEATDTYESNGDWYFTRTIRFAQFPETVTVRKRTPQESAQVLVDGQDAQNYAYLASELIIFRNGSEFPFPLSECARLAFPAR
jgi:hypothetical protein